MPTKKISDDTGVRPCRHYDHEPQKMQALAPGTYEHKCPACEETTVFRVMRAELGVVT